MCKRKVSEHPDDLAGEDTENAVVVEEEATPDDLGEGDAVVETEKETQKESDLMEELLTQPDSDFELV